MSNVIASTYRGHTIEPLVYPHFPAAHGKGARSHRRYLAAVTVTHLETNTTKTAKLVRDYEFFGDARRAAEARGRHLIDAPAETEWKEEGGAPIQTRADSPFSAGHAESAPAAQPGDSPFTATPVVATSNTSPFTASVSAALASNASPFSDGHDEAPAASATQPGPGDPITPPPTAATGQPT